MIDGKPFSNVLKCFWTAIRAGDSGVILMELPRNSCTDMSGAIKVAEMLDPDVLQIHVTAGGVPDSFYAKSNGKWQAYNVRPFGGL